MNRSKAVIGALSSDLFRVAALKVRGADDGAERFLEEARKRSSKIIQVS